MNQETQQAMLSDVCEMLGGVPYQTVWSLAQRGAFGPVRREGNRLWVSKSGVEAFKILSDKPDVRPNGSDPFGDQADLAQMCAYYHQARCSAIAILDHFRAARIAAQAAGDHARVALIDQALEHLPNATYERAPGGAWTVHVAGQSQTSRPSEPKGERS